KIGPLVADDRAAAEAVLAGLIAAAGAQDVFLDVPSVNANALALAQDLDLAPVFETARMYTGAIRPLQLERVFGVTTFELGVGVAAELFRVAAEALPYSSEGFEFSDFFAGCSGAAAGFLASDCASAAGFGSAATAPRPSGWLRRAACCVAGCGGGVFAHAGTTSSRRLLAEQPASSAVKTDITTSRITMRARA